MAAPQKNTSAKTKIPKKTPSKDKTQKKLTPKELWINNPDKRSLPDFSLCLNAVESPSLKTTDELFQAVFGPSSRPEDRLHVSENELPEAYALIHKEWPKANGKKSAVAKAKRDEKAPTAERVNTRKRTPKPEQERLDAAIQGLCTHTYRFHDARPRSSQVCRVEQSSRDPYVFAGSVAPEDSRVSPTYTAGADYHDKAALLEAEVLLDGHPFSLALALAQNDARSSTLLNVLGYTAQQRPLAPPPTGNGTTLIVKNEQGHDLLIVPNVAVNVTRALNTAKYRKGSSLARRSRIFSVGGSQRQNAGFLNSTMSHVLIEQSLPWRAPLDLTRVQKTLMSSRHPLTALRLREKEIESHPLLRLQTSWEFRNGVARDALLGLFERMIKPVLAVHDALRSQTLSPSFLNRVKLAGLKDTLWRRLLLGTLERGEVRDLAKMMSDVIWAIFQTPSNDDETWTIKILVSAIEAIRPQTPLLQ